MSTAPAVSESRLMVILWAALASSVLMYGVVAFVATPGGAEDAPSFEEALQNPIVGALHLAGLGVLAISAMIPGILLKASRKGRATEGPPVPGAPVRVSPAVRTACIVQWALTEAPAVIGLVLAFLTRQPLLFAPLGLLSIMGFVFTFPTEDRLRRLEERTRQPY